MSACPKCQVFSSSVQMTRRLRNGWVKRWRSCTEPACKTLFRTIEIPEGELDLDPDAPGLMHVQRGKK